MQKNTIRGTFRGYLWNFRMREVLRKNWGGYRKKRDRFDHKII
jgi:hypothetical protein